MRVVCFGNATSRDMVNELHTYAHAVTGVVERPNDILSDITTATLTKCVTRLKGIRCLSFLPHINLPVRRI